VIYVSAVVVAIVGRHCGVVDVFVAVITIDITHGVVLTSLLLCRSAST
jgi:molybdopterin-binding protein